MNKHENLRSVFEKIKESVRPSFYANAEDVRQSLLFDFFAESDKPLAAECCLIITEVLRNIPDGVITVDGEERAADMVQEVFTMLTHEHIEQVIETFKRLSFPVRLRKAYLRTMLYNSVFELEAALINDVSADTS